MQRGHQSGVICVLHGGDEAWLDERWLLPVRRLDVRCRASSGELGVHTGERPCRSTARAWRAMAATASTIVRGRGLKSGSGELRDKVLYGAAKKIGVGSFLFLAFRSALRGQVLHASNLRSMSDGVSVSHATRRSRGSL